MHYLDKRRWSVVNSEDMNERDLGSSLTNRVAQYDSLFNSNTKKEKKTDGIR